MKKNVLFSFVASLEHYKYSKSVPPVLDSQAGSIPQLQ